MADEAFPNHDRPRQPTMASRPGPILALDSGSPRVSVAIGLAGRVLAAREVAQQRSSLRLLPLIAEVLEEAACPLRELAGIVALRGPGSFTGLRIGLATALGLHQATGVPATAWPTFGALAAQAPATAPRVAALIDALRGEWFAQPFGPPPERVPAAEPAILEASALPGLADAYVGFGIAGLQARQPDAEWIEAAALAPTVAHLASLAGPVWDEALLSRPLYLREPAVTPLGA